VGAADHRPGIRRGTWSPVALGLSTADLWRPAIGRRRTPAYTGARTRTEQGEERRAASTTRTAAEHCRPASRPPAAPTGAIGSGSEGRLRVRGNPNYTPPPFFYSMSPPGPAGPTRPRGPSTGRPAHQR
jgi:hypothetical protein